jgi:hypothetical protein
LAMTSLIFKGLGAYPSSAGPKRATLAFSANIKVGWKRLTLPNTLTYYNT